MGDFFDMIFDEVAQELISNAFMIGRLFIAALCGSLIGLERSRRQKDAGIRTHMIVALGAALAMLVSKYGFFDLLEFESLRADASRIASNVITGVSFIGAGVIFVKDISIKGLTTAAGIWTTASVGLAIGAGMYTVGLVATAFMIVFQLVLHRYFKMLENTSNEFAVTLINSATVINEFKALLDAKNIHIESCKMEKNTDNTVTLDIVIKKSRSMSMNDIFLLIENNPDVVSISI